MPSESTPLLRLPMARGPMLLWRTGCIITSIGIMAGAFGAHGIRKQSGITERQMDAWKTASSYAIYNGLGLMLVSLHPKFAHHKFAGPAIAAGTSLFSGSIMALVLNENLKFLGPITPIGGVFMIAGYLSLAF
ncbi:hypothetical protein C8J56DRAFT_919323 [Mycena floridula]|nr:hypothetical protein C8J56DRAFT_919323 [Mycena floridula]